MPRHERSSRVALVGVLVLAPALARAQDAELQLEWQAVPGCPDAAAVRARVRELRAPHDAGRVPRPVRARASITQDHEWRLRLQTETAGGAGERTLTGASCDEVAEAAALILALAADETTATNPAPVPLAAPSERPASVASVAPPVAPRRREPALRLFVRVDAALDVGSLPSASPGVAVAAGVARARWRVELSAFTFAAQRATLAGGVGGDVGVSGGLARGCLGVLNQRFGLDACAGLEGAWMYGEGVGLPDARSGGAMRWAARVGLAARWRVTSAVRLRALIEPAVELAGPTFVVENAGAVHEPSAVFLNVFAGVEAGD